MKERERGAGGSGLETIDVVVRTSTEDKRPAIRAPSRILNTTEYVRESRIIN